MATKQIEPLKVPNICTVIYGSSLQDLENQAKQAIKIGANHVEVRLDLCDTPLDLPLEELAFPSLKTILTMRHPREGGNPKHQDSREEIIKRILKTKADYIDIEIENMHEITGSKRDPNRLIISKHWFSNMPSIEELAHLREKHGKRGILKLIPTADNYFDNLTVFN